MMMLRAERRAVFPHEDFGIGGAVAAVVSAQVYLEMQVRSTGVPGGTYDAERFVGGYHLSFVDKRLGGHVAVAGDDTAGVVDVDVPAFSAPST